MITVRNHAKERLEAGELALGVGLRQARTVDIAKIMKTAGYDFLFIDMEHNSMSIDLAAQISVAAQDAGITPVVRVPAFEHFHATRALDAGAQGIVVPHVDTAEIAARMVEQLQISADRPSLGHRRPAPAGLQARAAGRGDRRDQQRDAPDPDARDARGDRQRRGDRRGARVRRAAGRHQRSVHGDGHPRPARSSAHRRGVRAHRRRVPGARQIRRPRRRVRPGADAALSGDGLSPGARRQRPDLHARRRQGARRRGARDESR